MNKPTQDVLLGASVQDDLTKLARSIFNDDIVTEMATKGESERERDVIHGMISAMWINSFERLKAGMPRDPVEHYAALAESSVLGCIVKLLLEDTTHPIRSIALFRAQLVRVIEEHMAAQKENIAQRFTSRA